MSISSGNLSMSAIQMSMSANNTTKVGWWWDEWKYLYLNKMFITFAPAMSGDLQHIVGNPQYVFKKS